MHHEHSVESVNPIRIGKLAREAGITVDAIRFYEREQLIEPLSRSSAGYRLYDSTAIERLRFIRRAQALGFSLSDVRELIKLGQVPDASCEPLSKMFEQKIEQLNAKIRDLHTMQDRLRALASQCQGAGRIARCGLLESLKKELGEA